MTVGVAKPLTTDQKMMQSLREDLLEPGDEEQQQTIGSYPGLRHALQAAQEEVSNTFQPADPASAPTPAGRHCSPTLQVAYTTSLAVPTAGV